MENLIVMGTGHRPDKLGGYTIYNSTILPILTNICVDVLESLPVTRVISGMALGFDTALALAAMRLDLQLICAVPYPNQLKNNVSEQDKEIYKDILDYADTYGEINYITSEPPKSKSAAVSALFQRNHWMIYNSNFVLTCYNGERKGGTFEALNYIRKYGTDHYILHLWNKYKNVLLSGNYWDEQKN